MVQKYKRIIGGAIRNHQKKIKIAGIAIIFLVFLFLILKLFSVFRTNQVTPDLLTSLLNVSESPLKSSNGRTNFLLLGVPGKNNIGIDLTDTIIFMSINVSNNDVLMVSIPRDIWINLMKDKINTAYHYGETAREGGGFVLSKSVVEEVIGQPIHYSLLVDFDGFINLVDTVGGLDISVERSFVDEKFPIPGKENDLCNGDLLYRCRYETIRFEKGVQHMNGETALKYVRSRNAKGEEGTDFARSARQRQVLFGFQNKLLSFENLNPQKATDIINVVKDSIRTDLELGEAVYLARFAFGYDGSIRSVPLDWGDPDTGEVGFLVNPPVEKYEKWALEPRTGNFDEIHEYIRCSIEDPNCQIAP